MKRLLAIALVAILAACASTVAQTPQQRVFALQTEYNGVLTAAVAYESQPRCTAVVTTKCSSTSIVAIIRKADIDAYAALKAAQDTVRAPGASDSTITLAITGAVNAIGAMKTVLTNHGVM